MMWCSRSRIVSKIQISTNPFRPCCPLRQSLWSLQKSTRLLSNSLLLDLMHCFLKCLPPHWASTRPCSANIMQASSIPNITRMLPIWSKPPICRVGQTCSVPKTGTSKSHRAGVIPKSPCSIHGSSKSPIRAVRPAWWLNAIPTSGRSIRPATSYLMLTG